MTTDLEDQLRAALRTRGDAITPATLRGPVPTPTMDDSPIQTDRSVWITTSAPPPIGKRCRPAAVWLTAAAVAAALVTGLTMALTGMHPSFRIESGGGATSSTHNVARRLPFAATFPAGFRIASVVSQTQGCNAIGWPDCGQIVEIASARTRLELVIDPPDGRPRRFRSDAHHVTVGTRPGYFGVTWTDAQYDHDNDDLLTSLSWKYNGVAYASLTGGSVDGRTTLDEANLQQVASWLDFTKHTAIRVGVAVHKLPPGTRFAAIDSTYEELDPNSASHWESAVSLDVLSSPRDGISISLCRCASTKAQRDGRSGSRPTTLMVRGRPAYLYSNGEGGGSVEVDEGHGVSLVVSSSHDEDGPWTGRIDMLVALARSVTITSHPDAPAMWFDAAVATK